MVHLKGNSTRKSVAKPGNKNGKSASNSVRLRIGNVEATQRAMNATRKAMQNAAAAAASKRQSVVTVAVPKNNPGLLAHIKRLLGMNNGR